MVSVSSDQESGSQPQNAQDESSTSYLNISYSQMYENVFLDKDITTNGASNS